MTLDDLPAWAPTAMTFASALSVALVLASLIGLPTALASLPADLLLREPPPDPPLRRFARNTVGWLLLVLGLLMLVLPGQGLLTMLAGMLLADFPGKRALTLRVLGQPRLRAAVDAVRARRGRPPLRSPDG